MRCHSITESSAGSLHKRGYRSAMGIAPLKENLAAGLVRLTGWEGDVPLVDPLCGSGILLIEAVSSVLGLAPGLNRSFLFEGWADFDENLWKQEIKSAKHSYCNDKKLPLIIGCEQDSEIADQAIANVKAAGLQKFIKIQNSHFCELIFPHQKGIMRHSLLID